VLECQDDRLAVITKGATGQAVNMLVGFNHAWQKPGKPPEATPARRDHSLRPATLGDVAHLPGQPAPLPAFITRGLVP
jgi:hypothetical protein